jgi:hypothetical protein
MSKYSKGAFVMQFKELSYSSPGENKEYQEVKLE